MTRDIPLAVGQTWLPCKPGTGWRHIAEFSGEPGWLRYSTKCGTRRRVLWVWEFRDWCRRYECILAPRDKQCFSRLA